MKKTAAALISVAAFIIISLFSFPAFAAVYTPDVEIYAKAYALVNLDDPSFPVVAQKSINKKNVSGFAYKDSYNDDRAGAHQ